MLIAQLLMVDYSQSVSAVLKITNANVRLKYNGFLRYISSRFKLFKEERCFVSTRGGYTSFRLFKVPSSGL